jgi:hypothetical protein
MYLRSLAIFEILSNFLKIIKMPHILKKSLTFPNKKPRGNFHIATMAIPPLVQSREKKLVENQKFKK